MGQFEQFLAFRQRIEQESRQSAEARSAEKRTEIDQATETLKEIAAMLIGRMIPTYPIVQVTTLQRTTNVTHRDGWRRSVTLPQRYKVDKQQLLGEGWIIAPPVGQEDEGSFPKPGFVLTTGATALSAMKIGLGFNPNRHEIISDKKFTDYGVYIDGIGARDSITDMVKWSSGFMNGAAQLLKEGNQISHVYSLEYRDRRMWGK